jgi:hypothetical protein
MYGDDKLVRDFFVRMMINLCVWIIDLLSEQIFREYNIKAIRQL